MRIGLRGMKVALARRLTPEVRKALLRNPVVLSLFGRDLRALARLAQTDKWGLHCYAQHYQHHFSPLRRKVLNLLEIGVGGHDSPHRGGASLRMWKAYFQRGHIFGLDLFDKRALQEPRLTIYQGDQSDPECLRHVASQIGRLDVVIDDGSHVNAHVITTFKTLFPLMPPGGIYAIEDTCTSYWPSFGGSEDPNAPDTSMSMLKGLVDGLNWEEFWHRQPDSMDQIVTQVHFYHNLCIIYKGTNREGASKHLEHVVRQAGSASRVRIQE